MKILSTILYSDVAILAIIAGREYCSRSWPIVAVPRAAVEDLGDETGIFDAKVMNILSESNVYVMNNNPMGAFDYYFFI